MPTHCSEYCPGFQRRQKTLATDNLGVLVLILTLSRRLSVPLCIFKLVCSKPSRTDLIVSDDSFSKQRIMLNNLTGHRAFVTGSTMGIGAAISDAIGVAGGHVLRHGRSIAELATVDHDFELSDCVFGDFADDLPSSAVKIADEALAKDPLIDLLVCNAGIYIDEPFLDMSFDTFQTTLNVNVGAVFAMVQKFAQTWSANQVAGRIVITGSINGRLSEPTHVAYDTSKGAVEAMVRSLAVSLADVNIRVNGVAPGLFETPLTSSAINAGQNRRWMELHTPNGKIPEADAAAGTVVFLLSDASQHMIGQMLFVDGGMSIWQQPDAPS